MSKTKISDSDKSSPTDASGNEGPDAVSKSERKRQMHRLQKLGTELVDLKLGLVENLNPSTLLVDAIALARITKKNEALRRQMQYIGKLMRKEDPLFIERCEQLLKELNNQSAQQIDELHQCERWRDRILGEDSTSIEAFILQYPTADRQWLRQIRRQCAHELKQQEPASARAPASARKLYTYVRDIIQTSNKVAD